MIECRSIVMASLVIEMAAAAKRTEPGLGQPSIRSTISSLARGAVWTIGKCGEMDRARKSD